MKQPRIVAFIFARGGSKGLPYKNIYPLAGQPLIVHSIKTALALPSVSRVIVSTDDEEIAEISRQAGADIPFIRPAELANDNAPEWLSWQHAIRSLREQGDTVDIFLSLPPTSPLRTPEDVNCCIDAFLSNQVEVIISVRESQRSPYFNMVKRDFNGNCQLALDGKYSRRQETPELFDITTVAYVAQADFIMKFSRIFDGKVKAVLIPQERALDIDTHFDMLIAEALFGKVDKAGAARLL
jgi:CMP-N-acetylneuraminic acid synthetase